MKEMTELLWFCTRCGNFGFHSEACIAATVAAASPVLSETTRYRVRGRITPMSRKGEFYDVDLVVEADHD